mgnify:CR=1 FL=1
MTSQSSCQPRCDTACSGSSAWEGYRDQAYEVYGKNVVGHESEIPDGYQLWSDRPKKRARVGPVAADGGSRGRVGRAEKMGMHGEESGGSGEGESVVAPPRAGADVIDGF